VTGFYGLALAGLAAAGGVAFGLYQSAKLDAARQSLAIAEATGRACYYTLDKIQEGRAIDNSIPDSLDGFSVPLEWVLPVPGTSSPGD
jgi:hypothetical protein